MKTWKVETSTENDIIVQTIIAFKCMTKFESL